MKKRPILFYSINFLMLHLVSCYLNSFNNEVSYDLTSALKILGNMCASFCFVLLKKGLFYGVAGLADEAEGSDHV